MGKHLTWEQRVEIQCMVKLGRTEKEMAAYLGCSLRTIYYELERGQCTQLDGGTWTFYSTYDAATAQRKHDANQTSKGPSLKLGSDWEFVRFIEAKIKDKYSPRAALAEAKKAGLALEISHTTLYNWIDKGYLGVSNKDLPEGKRPVKKKAEKIAHRKCPLERSIEKRPAEVAERKTFGHWELDTVIGQKEGTQHCLLVMTEKKTKMELVRKMKSKTAAETVRVLDEIRAEFGSNFPRVFRTITCDNGVEFSDFRGIEKDETKLFYCHPYSSWERGQNENANKLIRRFVPKGKSINNYTDEQIAYVERWMNNYPRQVLGWARPIDLFHKELASL